MRGWRRISLGFLMSLVFVASTLSVCNAHLSASEHPDCIQCLATASSRREDGIPAPLPVGPHHCPDHACTHLHAPFILGGSLTPMSLPVFWFFPLTTARHGQELPSSLFRPPQA